MFCCIYIRKLFNKTREEEKRRREDKKKRRELEEKETRVSYESSSLFSKTKQISECMVKKSLLLRRKQGKENRRR